MGLYTLFLSEVQVSQPGTPRKVGGSNNFPVVISVGRARSGQFVLSKRYELPAFLMP